jgi:hypothetical protein
MVPGGADGTGSDARDSEASALLGKHAREGWGRRGGRVPRSVRISSRARRAVHEQHGQGGDERQRGQRDPQCHVHSLRWRQERRPLAAKDLLHAAPARAVIPRRIDGCVRLSAFSARTARLGSCVALTSGPTPYRSASVRSHRSTCLRRIGCSRGLRRRSSPAFIPAQEHNACHGHSRGNGSGPVTNTGARQLIVRGRDKVITGDRTAVVRQAHSGSAMRRGM